MTIVVFIKFYQTYYQMNFVIQFCMFLILCLFAAWTVVIAIYIFAFYANKAVAVVAFCLAAFGYIMFCAIALGSLKVLTLPDKSTLPISLRVSSLPSLLNAHIYRYCFRLRSSLLEELEQQ